MSNSTVLIILLLFIVAILFIKSSSKDKYKEKKWNFIHIPKNAGTSIKNILSTSDIPIGYVGHDYPRKYKNEIVILRDPIDRFLSAFHYSKQKWPNQFNQEFSDPDSFVLALSDSASEKHTIALSLVSNDKSIIDLRNWNKNNIHKVLGKETPYIWTIMPQSTWCVNKPKHILRYEFLEKDFNSLLKSI